MNIRFKDKINQGGPFDYQEHQKKLQKYQRPLDKLRQRIDWQSFQAILLKHLDYKDQSRGGRPPFDPVLMLMILVLQRYYNLSDEECEFQTLDRESFRRFLGIDLSDTVQDRNTIWQFKERLGAKGIEACFEHLNQLLKGKPGCKAAKARW